MNLNAEKIRNADGDDYPPTNNSVTSDTASVFFRNLPESLVQQIQQSAAVVGCAAWLTHPDVLRALAHLECGASIIVQKEDFLRPDINSSDGVWQSQLRQMYDAIDEVRWHSSNYADGIVDTNNLLHELSVCGVQDGRAIRCCGNHNADKTPAHPRMHNKFFVFFDKTEEMRVALEGGSEEMCTIYTPRAVWTGSFNPTTNGGMSLENAVLIRDRAICDAYVNEWAQILAISEPLDWTSAWVAPQYRCGT